MTLFEYDMRLCPRYGGGVSPRSCAGLFPRQCSSSPGDVGACPPASVRVGPLHLGQIDAFLHHLVERRHLAELLDLGGEELDHVIDLLLGGEAAEAEPDRAVREVGAGAPR